jgi:hypothetical protein
MDALLVGPIFALSFTGTILIGKLLLHALLKAIEHSASSAK